MCVFEAITVVVLIQKAGYIVSSPYYSYMGALSVQLKNMHLYSRFMEKQEININN